MTPEELDARLRANPSCLQVLKSFLAAPPELQALTLSLRYDVQDTGPFGIVANVSRHFLSSVIFKLGAWVQPRELCQNCYRRRRRLTAYLVQPDGLRQRTIDPCLHCAGTINWRDHYPLSRVEYEVYQPQPGSQMLVRTKGGWM